MEPPILESAYVEKVLLGAGSAGLGHGCFGRMQHGDSDNESGENVSTSQGSPAAEITLASLEGTWSLAAALQQGDPKDMNVPVRMEVAGDGAYNLNATCNSMNGWFSVEGGVLHSTPLASTRMSSAP